MRHIPHFLGVGNLMYAKVCTRLDTDHGIGILIRFLSNDRKILGKQ